jgi:tetratricopeptide (TPR) repeat protein
VRVTPQLINVADGTQMWSQPSDAILSSAFTIQSEIAGNVASALNLTLLQQEKQTLEAKLTENPDAYDYYLRGNQYMLRSSEERGYRVAEDMFLHAVALDPKFAAAYARLGALHSHMFWEMYDHTAERVKKSKDAADQALRLAPDLPDAHGAMGWYYYHCLRDYENAMKEFNLALATQPSNLDLLLGIGSIYRRLGHFDSTLIYFKRALESDPRSGGLMAELGVTLIQVRKYNEADEYLSRSISVEPEIPQTHVDRAFIAILARGDIGAAQNILSDASTQKIDRQDLYFIYFWVWINLIDGKYREIVDRLGSTDITALNDQYWSLPKDLVLAEANDCMDKPVEARKHYDAARVFLEHEVQLHPDDARLHSSLGIAYAGLGRKEDAVREGKRGVDIIPLSKEAIIVPLRMADLARIYTMTGDHNGALDMLEKLLSIPAWISVPLLKLDPVWKPLRNNPRFQRIVTGQ